MTRQAGTRVPLAYELHCSMYCGYTCVYWSEDDEEGGENSDAEGPHLDGPVIVLWESMESLRAKKVYLMKEDHQSPIKFFWTLFVLRQSWNPFSPLWIEHVVPIQNFSFSNKISSILSLLSSLAWSTKSIRIKRRYFVGSSGSLQHSMKCLAIWQDFTCFLIWHL